MSNDTTKMNEINVHSNVDGGGSPLGKRFDSICPAIYIYSINIIRIDSLDYYVSVKRTCVRCVHER